MLIDKLISLLSFFKFLMKQFSYKFLKKLNLNTGADSSPDSFP